MGNLCTDQLIGKLVALLREADPDKFDDAVAQAKNQLTAEAKQVKRDDIEKLGRSQIQRLKDLECPEQIVEILEQKLPAAIKKASEMTFGDGNIPLLPVIPRTFRSPYDLMAMVRNAGKVGYNYLNPRQISDVVDIPQEPYYIYDVEDGRRETLGKTSLDAEKMITRQNRHRHTVAEDMALTTHTIVLSHHYLLSTGSLYDSDYVPSLWLDGGRPWLGCSRADRASSLWGSASCGSR